MSRLKIINNDVPFLTLLFVILGILWSVATPFYAKMILGHENLSTTLVVSLVIGPAVMFFYQARFFYIKICAVSAVSNNEKTEMETTHATLSNKEGNSNSLKEELDRIKRDYSLMQEENSALMKEILDRGEKLIFLSDELYSWYNRTNSAYTKLTESQDVIEHLNVIINKDIENIQQGYNNIIDEINKLKNIDINLGRFVQVKERCINNLKHIETLVQTNSISVKMLGALRNEVVDVKRIFDIVRAS